MSELQVKQNRNRSLKKPREKPECWKHALLFSTPPPCSGPSKTPPNHISLSLLPQWFSGATTHRPALFCFQWWPGIYSMAGPVSAPRQRKLILQSAPWKAIILDAQFYSFHCLEEVSGVLPTLPTELQGMSIVSECMPVQAFAFVLSSPNLAHFPVST